MLGFFTCSCSSIRIPLTLKEIYVKIVTRALAIILLDGLQINIKTCINIVDDYFLDILIETIQYSDICTGENQA